VLSAWKKWKKKEEKNSKNICVSILEHFISYLYARKEGTGITLLCGNWLCIKQGCRTGGSFNFSLAAEGHNKC